MRRTTVALMALIILSACSSDGDSSEPTVRSTITPGAVTSEEPAPSDVPVTVPSDDEASGDEASGDEASGDEASGDGAAVDVLAEAGLLDAEGRVAYGPVVPDAEFDAVICEYVFGTTDEVIELAGLPADAVLLDGSGPAQLGGGGGGVRCGYGEGGEGGDAMLAVRVWNRASEAVAPDDGQHQVEVEVDRHWAWLGFHPDYTGEAIEPDLAERWLTEAGGRWSGGSV